MTRLHGRSPLPQPVWFVLLVDELDKPYWHGFVIILAVDVNMARAGGWIHPRAWALSLSLGGEVSDGIAWHGTFRLQPSEPRRTIRTFR